MPGIIIGHNDRIAWGITNLGFDVQDLYRGANGPGVTGRYVFKGTVEQADASRNSFTSGARSRSSTNWVTRHGPMSGQYQDSA